MTQLCASPPPSINKADREQMFKGNMKRSPRCMQIDLLPLIASNIMMTGTESSPHGPADRPNAKISPAVWNEKLRLWTRNKELIPSTFNSEIDSCLDEQMHPESNTKELCLMDRNADDKDSSTGIQFSANDKDATDEIQFFTSSTTDDQFPHENIGNAAGRAWLSSLLHISNYQAKDVIAPPLDWTERENQPEEAPQLHPVVETTWDADKIVGHETLSNPRSQTLNDWQLCTSTQLMPHDEGDQRIRIHEDHFVDPHINKPQKLCSPFTSPWFNSKAPPFSETQSNFLDENLDWTGGEARDGGDDMDAQGFDGLGIRPESERNRVRSRQYWNGDEQNSSRRNVRQRFDNDPTQNIIANEFLDNYDGFGPGDNLPRWFPQPGDILITKRPRPTVQNNPGGHMTIFNPGGHVTLYKDPVFFHYIGRARLRTIQHDFGDGDFVIRLGKFTEDWKWHPSPSIEAFLCDLRQVCPWWLVGRTYNSELQPPEYQVDQFRAPVNVVDRSFRPRAGDLVIRVVPGEYSWGLFWWTHYFNFYPCDLVLRAGYEVRANGTCMVVELFYRELDDRDWSFRGRDVWTYLQNRSPPASPPEELHSYGV